MQLRSRDQDCHIEKEKFSAGKKYWKTHECQKKFSFFSFHQNENERLTFSVSDAEIHQAFQIPKDSMTLAQTADELFTLFSKPT